MEPLRSMLNEQPFSKSQFTMLVGDVENRLEILRRQRPVDTIILVGIETHVCIIATCIDLIHRGFNVSWNINSRHFMIRLGILENTYYLIMFQILMFISIGPCGS